MAAADTIVAVSTAGGHSARSAVRVSGPDALENAVPKGDKAVQLVGFGTFSVKKRAARKGRNPQTGETIKIKASKTVGFRAGKNLKEKI